MLVVLVLVMTAFDNVLLIKCKLLVLIYFSCNGACRLSSVINAVIIHFTFIHIVLNSHSEKGTGRHSCSFCM